MAGCETIDAVRAMAPLLLQPVCAWSEQTRHISEIIDSYLALAQLGDIDAHVTGVSRLQQCGFETTAGG
jgi:hypothetical protein